MGAMKRSIEEISEAMGYGGLIDEHSIAVAKRVFDLDVEPAEALELIREITGPMFTSEQVDEIVRMRLQTRGELWTSEQVDEMVQNVVTEMQDKSELRICAGGGA